jgi:hypothetical protein
MYTVENFLDIETTKKIISLIDYEIKNNLCPSISKYQSYNNMHFIYEDDKYFDIFLRKLVNEVGKYSKNKMEMTSCWFNVCKEDSNFGFHDHPASDLTCVFFLKNCNENGTIFKFENTLLQLLVKDNSLVFFDPSLTHSVPEWKGSDRYTIAADFIITDFI